MFFKYFKPINTRYIYNGLIMLLFVIINMNDITTFTEFHTLIFNFIEKANIKIAFVYLTIFYLVGIIVSFVGFIIIEVIIENILKYILSKIEFLNIVDIHYKIAKKITKEQFSVSILKNLDNYKKLEVYLLKKDKNLYDAFIQNKKIIIQTRDLFAIFFMFTFYSYTGVKLIIIIGLLIIFSFIVTIYEDIILKNYVEVCYKYD